MKTSTLPIVCGISLAAISAAGLSHWWSVRQFMSAVDSGIPVKIQSSPAPTVTPLRQSAPVKEIPATTPVLAAAKSPAVRPANLDSHEKAFFEALTAKIENLQNQNRDLLDQVAETNRDLMKLEFRVDTHSEQFRPLPVSEDREDTSFEEGPGVLPPRAEPVLLPTQ